MQLQQMGQIDQLKEELSEEKKCVKFEFIMISLIYIHIKVDKQGKFVLAILHRLL